jgi:hypothetical protein
VKNWLLLFFLITVVPVRALDTLRTDLKPAWLMAQEHAWVQHDGKGKTAHLPLDQCPGAFIEFEAKNPFTVFINNRLIHQSVNHVRFSVDSLKNKVGNASMLTIFSASGVSSIVCRSIVIQPENVWKKKPNSNASFLITMSMVLVTALLALIRTNPAVATDYFSFGKIFSIRKTDDTPTVRLTTSSNLLYVVFIVALLGTLLFILRNGSAVLWLGFRLSLAKAIIYCGYVGLFVVVKILWVHLLTGVFGLTDFRAAQIQDYLRLILASALFCGFVLLLFVILGMDWRPWLSRLEFFLACTQVVYTVLVYLKLMAQGGFTVFHLFSYLCLAEIIPLILLFKIYFS